MIQVIDGIAYQEIDLDSIQNDNQNLINGLQINIDAANAQINLLNQDISEWQAQVDSLNQDISVIPNLKETQASQLASIQAAAQQSVSQDAPAPTQPTS